MSNVKSDTGAFALIPVWVIDVVPKNVLATYCVLASYADNNTGECYPSHRTLAEKLDVSISTVKRDLRELEKCGVLKIENRFNSDGSPTSNLYMLNRINPKGFMSELGRVKSEPTTEQTGTDNDSEVSYKLDSINYTHLTKNLESKDSDSLEDSKKQRANIWDALVKKLEYTKADITKNVRGQLNNAVKQLYEIGASPSEVEHRADLYKQMFPNSAFTAMALCNRWGELKTKTISQPSKTIGGIDYDSSTADVWQFNDNGDVIYK